MYFHSQHYLVLGWKVTCNGKVLLLIDIVDYILQQRARQSPHFLFTLPANKTQQHQLGLRSLQQIFHQRYLLAIEFIFALV